MINRAKAWLRSTSSWLTLEENGAAMSVQEWRRAFHMLDRIDRLLQSPSPGSQNALHMLDRFGQAH